MGAQARKAVLVALLRQDLSWHVAERRVVQLGVPQARLEPELGADVADVVA
jgi:hypothetical protein